MEVQEDEPGKTQRQTVVGPAHQAKKCRLDLVSEGELMEDGQQENGGVLHTLWQKLAWGLTDTVVFLPRSVHTFSSSSD